MDRSGLVPFAGHISSMSGAAGFEDFWKGRADPMTFSGKEIVLAWPQMGRIFSIVGRPTNEFTTREQRVSIRHEVY